MFKKKLTRKRKITYIILGSLIVLLIAFRIALPYILLKYVNKQLTRIEGYRGHVEDIDVALFRGAYVIKEIKLDKTGGKIPVPFFKANKMDLSIQWNALLHGRVVAEIIVDRPVLNFVNGPSKETTQTSVDKSWIDVVDKLIPFKLNRFEIHDGEIHYKDFYSSPKVDLAAKNVEIVAENLSNTKHAKDTLPSTARATASVYDGTAKLEMKIDPLAKKPTYDMNVTLTAVSLVKVNDFLKAYGNFDAEKGTIGLYTEAAAKDGLISGYTKPIIKDLKVVSWKEDKDKPLKLVWESLIEVVGFILTNHKKDQIATKASFEGRIGEADVSTFAIIGQLLRNAFIQALYPSLENSININTINEKEEHKTFLGKLFSKNNADKNKKSQDKK
ncbi:MAG: DUF748 domain-containing protein [Chitinophagaceae bacterium]